MTSAALSADAPGLPLAHLGATISNLALGSMSIEGRVSRLDSDTATKAGIVSDTSLGDDAVSSLDNGR